MIKFTSCTKAPLNPAGTEVQALYFTKAPGDKYLNVYARYKEGQSWVPLHIGLNEMPTLQQARDAGRNIAMDSGSYEDAHFYLRSAEGNNMTAAYFTNAQGAGIQAGNTEDYAPLNLQPEGGLLTYGGVPVATENWVQERALVKKEDTVTDFNLITEAGMYSVPYNLTSISNYPHIGGNNNGATSGNLVVYESGGTATQFFYPTYESATMNRTGAHWYRKSVTDTWEYKNGVLEIWMKFNPVNADQLEITGDYLVTGTQAQIVAGGYPDPGTAIPVMLSVKKRWGNVSFNYAVTQEAVCVQESAANRTRKWIRSRFNWDGGRVWDAWNEVGLLRDVYSKTQLNTSGAGGTVHWDNISSKPAIVSTETDPFFQSYGTFRSLWGTGDDWNSFRSKDTRGFDYKPAQRYEGIWWDFKEKNVVGLPAGGSHAGVLTMNPYADVSGIEGGANVAQIATYAHGLWHRTGNGAVAWNSWNKIITTADHPVLTEADPVFESHAERQPLKWRSLMNAAANNDLNLIFDAGIYTCPWWYDWVAYIGNKPTGTMNTLETQAILEVSSANQSGNTLTLQKLTLMDYNGATGRPTQYFTRMHTAGQGWSTWLNTSEIPSLNQVTSVGNISNTHIEISSNHGLKLAVSGVEGWAARDIIRTGYSTYDYTRLTAPGYNAASGYFEVDKTGQTVATGKSMANGFALLDGSYVHGDNTSWGFLTSSNAALPIKSGGLVVSNQYTDIAPDAGIFSKNGIQLSKASLTSGGSISFYSPVYKAWQIYMANAGTSGNGLGGGITPRTGTLVTGWGLRSFIEASNGFGWTWESGTSAQTAPDILAELSSQTGQFKLKNLEGAGDRMVVASATGILSTQAMPSAGGTNTPQGGITFLNSIAGILFADVSPSGTSNEMMGTIEIYNMTGSPITDIVVAVGFNASWANDARTVLNPANEEASISHTKYHYVSNNDQSGFHLFVKEIQPRERAHFSYNTVGY